MFARFTKHFLPVGAAAKLEAAALGAAEVRSEHVLLGVLRADAGSGAAALKAAGASLERARNLVAERRERSLHAVGVTASPAPPLSPDDERAVGAELPFDKPAHRLIEQALKICLIRGDKPLTDQHLVLALLEQRVGGAAALFADLGIDPVDLRQRLATPA